VMTALSISLSSCSFYVLVYSRFVQAIHAF